MDTFMKWMIASDPRAEICEGEFLCGYVRSGTGDNPSAGNCGSVRWHIFPKGDFGKKLAEGQIAHTTWTNRDSEYKATKRIVKSLLKVMDENADNGDV